MATQKDALFSGATQKAKGRTGEKNKPQALDFLTAAGRPLREVEEWPTDRLAPHPENENYFRPLDPREFAALREDIEEHGIHDALIVTLENEAGVRTILSGHNRWRAAQEIGLETIPVRAVVLTPGEEIQFIVRDKILRRQLDTEQKDHLIRKFLKRNPEMSNRAIAHLVGADHKTVGTKREEMASGGEIPHLEKRTGSDGKNYSSPPKPAKTASQTPEKPTEKGAEPRSKGNAPGAIERLLDARYALKKGSSSYDRRSIMQELGNIFREVMQQSTDTERKKHAAEIEKELKAWKG